MINNLLKPLLTPIDIEEQQRPAPQASHPISKGRTVTPSGGN